MRNEKWLSPFSKNPLASAKPRRRDFQNPRFPGFLAHSGRQENAEFRTLKHTRGMATWNSQVGVPSKRFFERVSTFSTLQRKLHQRRRPKAGLPPCFPAHPDLIAAKYPHDGFPDG